MVLGEGAPRAHHDRAPWMTVVKGRSPAHMPKQSNTRKIAFVGDYLPRKCGIATFTTDLRCAVAAGAPTIQCPVVPVNDLAEGYDYPPEVRFEILEQDLPSYLRAADFVNI